MVTALRTVACCFCVDVLQLSLLVLPLTPPIPTSAQAVSNVKKATEWKVAQRKFGTSGASFALRASERQSQQQSFHLSPKEGINGMILLFIFATW